MRFRWFKGTRSCGSPLWLLGLSLASSGALQAQWRAYGSLEGLARSEPISIQKALHGWKGVDGIGRRQYATLWAEAGVERGGWGVGVLRRMDYSLEFTPDTAALYGAIADDRALPMGKTYDVNVQGHGVEANGLRGFARRDVLPGMTLEVGVSLLRGTYMFEGGIRGTGRVTAPKTYTYSLWTDYTYTKDVLFEREVAPARGLGVALDMTVDWTVQPLGRLHVRVVDVAGFIQWRSLPNTQALALSTRTQTDEDAFQRWDPMVLGQEGMHPRFRQRLPPRGEASFTHQRHAWHATLGASCAFGDWLPRVGAGRTFHQWQVTGWYGPRDQALGVDVVRGRWRVGLSMDNPRPGRAHMIHLILSCTP